jgi:hypothetical protein
VTQTGPIGKISPSKQGHERRLERLYALKEVGECPFSADGITYQQGKEINGFIGAETRVHQTHLMSKRIN